MDLDALACRAAAVARDPRFDGAFVIAVATTGIYCRPVCPARTPRADRCTYYRLAAQAEAAGYRPCLRCRPEVAPGRGPIGSPLVAAAVAAIDRGFLVERSLPALAEHLGVTDRHLRRTVTRELGISPGALDRSRRLAVAKQLLHDSAASSTSIALAAGFGSVRRWNAAFRAHFATTPTAFRRRAGERPTRSDDALSVRLDARPPFAGRAALAFLAGRAVAGVEQVDGDRYLRTVDLDGHRGWLIATVRDDGPRVGVDLAVAASLAPRLLAIVARIRALFDLDAEPTAIDAHLAADPRLAPLVAACPGRRVPGAFDGFEVAVRTILGQQVSVAAASTLMGRLVAGFGAPLPTPHAGLTHVAPTAPRLAEASVDAIAAIGLPRARAETVRALARAVASGRLRLEPGADPATTGARLTAIPGIGPWTERYLSLRTLSWPDAFPAGDLVLRRALGVATERAAIAASEAWRPWRGYAALHLWAAASAARARGG